MMYCIMLFIGIWASMIDGVTIVVDNFVRSPLVGVEKRSCSLVKNVRKFSAVVRVYDM